MPTFKPKTTKKIKVDVNSNVTLDGKHKEMVSKFNEEEEKLPKLLQQKQELKHRLASKDLKIDLRINLEDKLFKVREEIKEIKRSAPTTKFTKTVCKTTKSAGGIFITGCVN